MATEITKEQVVDYLSNLPVIQVTELVKELEEKWGVSAAPVAVPTLGDGPKEEAAPEQTEFDVMLVSPGENRVPIIKLVREITEKGLKEAKGIVDACTASPQAIQEGVPKDIAEDVIKKIVDAGGEAELK